MDESSITFQLSISGPGEFGRNQISKSRKFKNMKLILNQVKKVASYGTNLVQCALMCLVNVVVWKKSKKYVTHIFLIQSRAGIELHLA